MFSLQLCVTCIHLHGSISKANAFHFRRRHSHSFLFQPRFSSTNQRKQDRARLAWSRLVSSRLVSGSIGSPGRPPSRPSRRSRSEPNKEHGGAGPTAACGPLARGPRELEGEGDRGWPTGPAVRLALPPLFLTPPLLLLRAPSILFPLLPYKKKENSILFAHHFISRLPIFHKYFHPSFFPFPTLLNTCLV